MDEDQLRELWDQSFDDLDSEDCDPTKTVKPIVHSDTLDFRSTTAAQTQNLRRSIESSEFPTPKKLLPSSSENPDESQSSEQDRPEPYRLDQEIGQGGNGIIYRAYQHCLDRDVAIKMAKADDEISYEKFTGEAKITGRLDHPNIVPVYDLGLTAKGKVLLAMKLVAGVSWLDLIQPKTEAHVAKAEQFFLDDHIRTLLSVCNAISFAHSKGIAHCDLKPENVMVGEFGEVLVMDWGIATQFNGPSSAMQDEEKNTKLPENRVTSPRGTPCYMSPELAEGRSSDIGPKSDIYLLGAILYELLTGHPPHRGPSIFKILWAASQSAPPQFEIEPDEEVSEELKEICRKSMSRDPEDRYGSVKEFRQALVSYLEHRESRQISNEGQKILRGCRRSMDRLKHSQYAKLSSSERDKLYAKFADAVASFRQAAFLWVDNPDAISGEREARLVFARAALRAGDLGLAEAQLKVLKNDADAQEIREAVETIQARRIKGRRTFKALRWAFGFAVFVVLFVLIVGVLFARMKNEEVEAKNKALDSALKEVEEQRREAETRLAAESAAKESERQAKDAERIQKEKATQALLDAKKNLAQIYVEKSRLSFNLDEWLANQAFLVKALSFDDQASTRLEILESEQHPFQWQGRFSTSLEKSGATSFAIQKQKQLLLFKNDFGTLKTLHIPSQSLQKNALSLPKNAGKARAFTLAQTCPYFAFTPEPGVLSLWNTNTKSLLWSKKAHSGKITRLSFSEDGERIVSLGADRTIKFWEAKTGRQLSDRKGPRRGQLSEIRFSRKDRWAAIFSHDNSRVLLFNGVSGDYIDELNGHKYGIAAVDFHPSEKWLVSAATDKTLRIWDLEKQRSIKILRGHNLPLTDVRVSPNGQWIASASRDKTARLWAFQSRLQIAVLSGHDSAVTALAFSQDSQRLATGSAVGKVRHWSVPQGRALIALGGHKNAIRSLQFASFGPYFHSFDGRSLQIWNLSGAISSRSLPLSKKDRFFTLHTQKAELIYGRENLWTRENIRSGLKQRYRADTDRDLESPAYHPKLDRALFATDRGEIAWISSSNVVLNRRKTAFDMIVTLRVNPDESVIIVGSQNRRPCVQFYKGTDLTPMGRVPEGLWQGIRWGGPSRAFAKNLTKPKTLYEIDMVSGLTKPFITLPTPIHFFHFSSDYKAIAIQCRRSRQLLFYDLETEEKLGTIDLSVDLIKQAHWSPDGHWLAYTGVKNQEEHLVIYDLKKRSELAVIPLRRFGSIPQLRFGPESRKLKLLVNGRKLRFVVWDLARLESLFSTSVDDLTRSAEKRSGLRVEGFQLIQIENKN